MSLFLTFTRRTMNSEQMHHLSPVETFGLGTKTNKLMRTKCSLHETICSQYNCLNTFYKH